MTALSGSLIVPSWLISDGSYLKAVKQITQSSLIASSKPESLSYYERELSCTTVELRLAVDVLNSENFLKY